MVTHASSWRVTLLRRLETALEWIQTNPTFTRFYSSTWFNITALIIFSFLATSLLTLSMNTLPSFIREGDVALKDIKATQNYEVVDKRSTERLREEAVGNVLPVYDWDQGRADEMLSRLETIFIVGRDVVEKAKEDRTALREAFEQAATLSIDEAVFSILLQQGFNPDLFEMLAAPLREILSQPIEETNDDSNLDRLAEIRIRHLDGNNAMVEEIWDDFSRITTVTEAKKFLNSRLQEALQSHRLTASEAEPLSAWLGSFVTSTFQFNRQETELDKQKALSNVKDVIIKIKVGEVIIRAGDRYNSWHKTVIEGIRHAQIETNTLLKFIGTLLLFLIISLSVYSYSKRYIKKFKVTQTDLYFLESAVLIALITLRLGGWFSSAVRDTLPVSLDVHSLYYAIPIAGIPMLVRMVLNAEIAFIFATLVSLLGGVYLGNSIELSINYFIASIVGTYAVAYADKRSTIIKAGALSGLASAAILLSFQLITVLSTALVIDWAALAFSFLLAFIAGLTSGVVALSLAPVAEFFFHYTTDIKLLELANLNHPLLKEMIVRAPGTYHHSHLVGILSEAGARAIGANPLLARVSCYYHDIGKMAQPYYFIENQRNGANRHDGMRPSESAAHIAAHVDDGLLMAKLYKLPPCITDMIPQHQGTKVMTYFYEKAKSQLPPGETLDDSQYRYPGPKPQSREAGIIMLADATEAAVRSLPEKNKDAIDSMVKKLMNRHFSDGQFDECELTLKDLHLIAQSFTDVLIGIYHNRIQYPESSNDEKSERINVFREGLG